MYSFLFQELETNAKKYKIKKETLIVAIVAQSIIAHNSRLYSISNISKIIGYNRSTVKKHLDELVTKNLFVNHKIDDPNSYPVPTPYFSNFVDLLLITFKTKKIHLIPLKDCRSVSDIQVSFTD
jgi:hypothetical protein